VSVDQTMLRLVLEEALSNALKYREPGTFLSAYAALEAHAADTSVLHIRLSNNNRTDLPRLSDTECARVFEPGYKARATSAMSDGIGLDTVARATSAAGGKAWLSTRDGS
jgi:signal transduction histidine kinase